MFFCWLFRGERTRQLLRGTDRRPARLIDQHVLGRTYQLHACVVSCGGRGVHVCMFGRGGAMNQSHAGFATKPQAPDTVSQSINQSTSQPINRAPPPIESHDARSDGPTHPAPRQSTRSAAGPPAGWAAAPWSPGRQHRRPPSPPPPPRSARPCPRPRPSWLVCRAACVLLYAWLDEDGNDEEEQSTTKGRAGSGIGQRGWTASRREEASQQPAYQSDADKAKRRTPTDRSINQASKQAIDQSSNQSHRIERRYHTGKERPPSESERLSNGHFFFFSLACGRGRIAAATLHLMV